MKHLVEENCFSLHGKAAKQRVWRTAFCWHLLCFLLLVCCCRSASAQGFAATGDAEHPVLRDGRSTAVALPDAPLPQSPSGGTRESSSAAARPEDPLPLSQTPSRLLHDEWHILASPVHVHSRDLRWLLPLAGATAASLATDSYTMRHVVSVNPNFNNSNDTTSTVLLDIFIGAPVALFGSGQLAKDNRERDAGLLAGQAKINAYVTDTAVKFIFLRERPQVAHARGQFFQADAASDPSFVSGHSIVAWSSAAALAETYSRPWQQAGLYTMATGVSLTRVLAQKHFPTDVFLGSVSGWLIGHYVAHSDRARSVPRAHKKHVAQMEGTPTSR